MKVQPFDQGPRLTSTLLLIATLVLIGLGASAAVADDSDGKTPSRTVIKATMHIDVTEVQEVLGLLDVHFAIKPDQNLIVVRGNQRAVENAIKVIDALDTPRPSIDLQVFVLAASKGSEVNIPKELEATVSHLKGVFGYSGFTLLDTVLLSVLEGRPGRVDGGLILGEGDKRTGYRFGFRTVSVVLEEGRTRNIRIKNLKFEVDGTAEDSLRASLMTDVQIREGQKAVIGSSTPEGIGETLVLVVQAKASADPNWAPISE